MQTARQPEPAKLSQIAIMTLCFNNILKLTPASTGTLEVFDIAQMYVDTYGVRNIEMQHSHIQSTEESYLKELKARYDRTQSKITNINIEFGAMTISAADPGLRVQAIDLTKRWVDHCVILGCPRLMLNQGQLTHDNKVWAIDALKKMADYGRSKGVRIGVETRGNGGAGGGRGAAAPAAGAAPGAAPAGAAQAPAAGAGAPPAAGGAGVAGAGAGRGAAAGRGGSESIPTLAVVPAWVLLSEVIQSGKAYANVDMGNVGAESEGELFAALRTFQPMTTGNTHTRVNANWNLARVVKFMTGPLGYTGLFSIEANGGHEAVRPIYNIVLDAL